MPTKRRYCWCCNVLLKPGESHACPECKAMAENMKEAHKKREMSLDEYLATEAERRQPGRKVIVT